jgi:sugar phosphate isomerase/epimerase
MGEGCIDIKKIRGWVEDAGFEGYNEVEIFSTRHWQEDQDDYLKRITSAYLQYS